VAARISREEGGLLAQVAMTAMALQLPSVGLAELLEAAPDAAVVIDARGQIVIFNRKAVALFGYSQQQVLGQTIEMLVPSRFRGHHVAHRGAFFSAPRVRQMGSGAELYALRSDGSEFPVEISLGPLETDAGPLVWGTILDVSERRVHDAALREVIAEREALLFQVREQEALLRTMLDNLPAGITCKDSQDSYRFTLLNDEIGELGFGRAEVGKNVHDLVPEAQATALMDADRKVIESGEIVRIPRQVLDTPKGRRILRMTKIPIPDRTGKPRYVLGVTENITEQDRFERLRDMQLRVTQTLAHSTSFDVAIPILLRSLAEATDHELACLWWVDAVSQRLRLRDSWTSTSPGAAFAQASAAFAFDKGAGMPGRVWATATPHILADATLATNFPRVDLAKASNVRRAFGFPIVGSDGVLGVIEVLSHRPDETTPALASILADLGVQIGQFHQRRIAEEERDRFFASSLNMYCIAGSHGYFTRINRAFEVLGYTLEDLTSRPFLDFVHPEDVGPTLAEIAKLSRGVPSVHFENRYRCKDGSYRWLLWDAAPGESGKIYASARDVTQRKDAEPAIQETEEESRQGS